MVLFLIFLLALIIRFLYFPDNIYFGYDQARDAFNALSIFKGDLKIVGPPTTFEGLNHGVLYWYILSPLYFFGGGNPEVVNFFLRIFNSLGVLLIFYLGKLIFNHKVGLMAAFLFAISFEQTQFAMYMGNPTLASLSVMLLFLGLAMVIFTSKNMGLILAMLGLGFSIQFQFALSYLVLPTLLMGILFYKSFLKIPIKIWIFSFLALIFSLASFIVTEIKFGFRTFHALVTLVGGKEKSLFHIFETFIFAIKKIVQYSISGELISSVALSAVLLIVLIYFFRQKDLQVKLKFLTVWFFSLVMIFIINGGVENLNRETPLYYPNIGISPALLIFVAFLIIYFWSRFKILSLLVLIFIIISNLQQIILYNPKSLITEINVQQGMLLKDEKKILDYLYQDAGGEPLAVKAVTMPFWVNTTWSYLFEWYGQKKYGYLPLWNGKNAAGFPGNLKVEEAQEKLPNLRYVIIEPLRGVAPHLVESYLKEEGYFTKVVEEKTFGQFIVQKRVKI